MTDSWKVVDLIQTTKSFFEKKGIVGSARLDAELLLAKVLRCRRIDLYLRFDHVLPEDRLSEFRELVRERSRRRPVKQLLGECEFMSHSFEITPDVLIPRPETETVVDHALATIGDPPSLVVDVGTGCGNIAVSIALARPQAAVYATDISEPAIAVARRNAERLGVADRVTLLHGDLLRPLAAENVHGRVDCIVSNPPYVAESELPDLMPEVALHEPRIALVSGPDGLGHIARLIADAPEYLRPGGSLVLELSPALAARATAAASANAAYAAVSTAQDLSRLDRVLIATKGK